MEKLWKWSKEARFGWRECLVVECGRLSGVERIRGCSGGLSEWVVSNENTRVQRLRFGFNGGVLVDNSVFIPCIYRSQS